MLFAIKWIDLEDILKQIREASAKYCLTKKDGS